MNDKGTSRETPFRVPASIVPVDPLVAAAQRAVDVWFWKQKAVRRSGSPGSEVVLSDAIASRHRVQRSILAQYLGCSPQDVNFDYECRSCGDELHGKPRLAGDASFSFSASSSRCLAGLAVTTGGEVGFDMEYAAVPPVTTTDLGAVGISVPKAGAALADGILAVFVWTQYEALLKAVGLGIAADPYAIADIDLAGWEVELLSDLGGYVATVAAQGPFVCRVRSWPADLEDDSLTQTRIRG